VVDANTRTGSHFANTFPPIPHTHAHACAHKHTCPLAHTLICGTERQERVRARARTRPRTHSRRTPLPPLQVGKKSNLQTLAALAGEHVKEAFHNTPWTLADERRAIQKIDPLTAKMRCVRVRARVRACVGDG
jgi:hypothetical protein